MWLALDYFRRQFGTLSFSLLFVLVVTGAIELLFYNGYGAATFVMAGLTCVTIIAHLLEMQRRNALAK